MARIGRTFHFSISSCLPLYCLTNSSSTCFKPSELVCRAGSTSLTVLSTKTPLIRRKHFRSGGSGCKVSVTSLSRQSDGMLRHKSLNCTYAPRFLARSRPPFEPVTVMCFCSLCIESEDLPTWLSTKVLRQRVGAYLVVCAWRHHCLKPSLNVLVLDDQGFSTERIK
jgi:hypothetical protein